MGSQVAQTVLNVWLIRITVQKWRQYAKANEEKVSPDIEKAVINICSNGITPIFILPAEPWRNGVIEKFNDKVQKTDRLYP